MSDFFKSKTFKNKQYLEYIRKQPCVICGHKSVPHHTEAGGMGMKCSDYRTIPLCNQHHTIGSASIHRMGKKTFSDYHCIDIDKIIIDLLEKFIEGLT